MIEGLSGDRMMIGLLIGIVFLILVILKTKIHSFIALILCTVIVGLIGGMPMTNEVIGGKTVSIVNSITSGFGGTLGSIGIIIGFGVIMGQIFEATGAAKRMAFTFLRLFGKNREEEAMGLTGFFVSIPIFCDSGFVILSPIAKAISRAVKKSVIGLGVALGGGLVITHTMVPPTPGPLGVCGIFSIDVGKFILYALVLSIPMTLGCLVYAKYYIPRKLFRIPNENGEIVDAPRGQPDFTTLLKEDLSDVPGTFESFAPLVLPILLILINTVSTAFGMTTGFMGFLVFLGQPIIAVGIGVLLSIVTLARRLDRKTALAEMEKGMASAGIIMLVTGGGGALGQIIKDSGLGTYMAEGMASANIPIIILPLAIATVMRFIQGSGTVAMTTAASISAPIVIAAGVDPIFGAIACCVGSLFFSYFNDSMFWVVNRMLGVSEVKEQMMVWSVTTTIAWAIGVVEVLVLELVWF